MARAHSGLQLQVLALYKRALLAARAKDQEALQAARAAAAAATDAARERQRGATFDFVRERFRDDVRSVGRMDFAVIEHLLRKGERDLKMLQQMKSASFLRVSHGTQR